MVSRVEGGRVTLDVSFVSFHDDRLPGTNVTDVKSPTSFVLTTGGFPQEIVLVTRALSAKLSRLVLRLNGAKEILLEKQVADKIGGGFEHLAECTLAPGQGNMQLSAQATKEAKEHGGMQVVGFDLDPETEGKDIKALRVCLLAGHDDFVALYSVEAWGEESQQRVAVLASMPEVNM